MGTKFMNTAVKAPQQNLNMNARALAAPVYGARQSGQAAGKDLGAAMGHFQHKKTTGSSAYPPGPKI